MTNVEKVLIYRIGSMGDTVVALPALKKIDSHFGFAKKRILTNFPVESSGKACALSEVIGTSIEVDAYIDYTITGGSLYSIWKLKNIIKLWAPDVLVYLMPRRTKIQMFRDWIFFKFCGIGKIYGMRWQNNHQRPKLNFTTGMYEPESERLVRLISDIASISEITQESWNLNINNSERALAKKLIFPLNGAKYIVFCAGTKLDIKDWGEDRWLALTHQLSLLCPGTALVLLGADSEAPRSQRLANVWNGISLNLCGKTNPRVSAAVLDDAQLYIGHDSGPMHLAAAMDTPTVAIFSSQNLQGHWFPIGQSVKAIYRDIDCAGCGKMTCIERNKECIRSISVGEVVLAAHAVAPSLFE